MRAEFGFAAASGPSFENAVAGRPCRSSRRPRRPAPRGFRVGLDRLRRTRAAPTRGGPSSRARFRRGSSRRRLRRFSRVAPDARQALLERQLARSRRGTSSTTNCGRPGGECGLRRSSALSAAGVSARALRLGPLLLRRVRLAVREERQPEVEPRDRALRVRATIAWSFSSVPSARPRPRADLRLDRAGVRLRGASAKAIAAPSGSSSSYRRSAARRPGRACRRGRSPRARARAALRRSILAPRSDGASSF